MGRAWRVSALREGDPRPLLAPHQVPNTRADTHPAALSCASTHTLPPPHPPPTPHHTTHSIACTLQLVTFFFIAILALHPHSYHPDDPEYPHFFKMPVLMLILITVLNDGTLISVAYDHVNPSHHPEKWNLKVGVGARARMLTWCARRGA
jgi:hypothetical protein